MDKVAQSNAATAEASAAAAPELNSQAVLMKQAAGPLTQLVGDSQHNAHFAEPAASLVASRKFNSTAAPRLPASTKSHNGNGHHPAVAKSELPGRRGEIPLDGDFKNF